MRKKNVLIVVAHADDMEFMAAGTVARLAGEKDYDVYQYILTDNAKGSYRLGMDEVVKVSQDEAIEAGKVLGLKEVRFGGYEDGELNQENPNVLREQVMTFIREIKADIVMGWDPWAPSEEHPDHRAASLAASDAAHFSGNPRFHPDCGFEPYPVTEAYWFAKHPRNAETYVDITETIDRKIEALLKHDCQMELTADMLRQDAAVIGVDLPLDDERQTYQQMIEMGVRRWAEDCGEKPGYKYAELFRYETLTMLTHILGEEVLTPDF